MKSTPYQRHDRSRWFGQLDHALLALAVQTGLRVSELTGLGCGVVQLGAEHVLYLDKAASTGSPPSPPRCRQLSRGSTNANSDCPDPLFPTSADDIAGFERGRSRPHPPRRERCAKLPFLGVQKPLTPCPSHSSNAAPPRRGWNW